MGPLAPNRVAIAYGVEGLASGGPDSLTLSHTITVVTRPNSNFIRVTAGAQSVRLLAYMPASPDGAELVSGGFSSSAVTLKGNVSPNGNQFAGADRIGSPAFWPSENMLDVLVLSVTLDPAFTQDSPRRSVLRLIA
ncbi:hypothetical protein [Hydrogenophaga sp.]|uniref:hypothetical protein n=1 Tax=Hydrogenophaga sp. TaxID=1904254 RepID=UPI0025B98C01|nr:hypothetical protein [Hydrogenophaga sp.]